MEGGGGYNVIAARGPGDKLFVVFVNKFARLRVKRSRPTTMASEWREWGGGGTGQAARSGRETV